MNAEYIETVDTVIDIPEKMGDNYLIQLFRERKFLYDKSDRNFKDNELKNNAWKEISRIMKDKNLGNFYTPEYCKKRITNLREQYIKLKKEQQLKSESAACTKKKSELLSELSFLDKYIQRRRTLTNVKESGKMPASSCNIIECLEANVAKNRNINKRSAEELLLSKQDNMENDSTENLCEHLQVPKKNKKSAAVKTKNNEDKALIDLTNATMNIAAQLEHDSTEKIGSTSVEDAFAEFISLPLKK